MTDRHPHDAPGALPPATYLESIHVQRGVACVNEHAFIRPAPVELTFRIDVEASDRDEDQPASSSSSSSSRPNLADALLDMRWKAEERSGDPVHSKKKKKATLEDVVMRQCARKVLLDNHKYTQQGHAARDMLLELFESVYELNVDKERVNASFARLKRNADTSSLPSIRARRDDDDERHVTLTFDHPVMAYHFLDRVTCAFDAATATSVMAWWHKETEHSASVDEWRFYAMKHSQMLKLATLLITPAEGQFKRSALYMHTGERWAWQPEPESLVKNPSLLMFALRVAMLMYGGKQMSKEAADFSSPQVCHLLGLRARGFLRKIDPRPTHAVTVLDADYEQRKAVALQYVYTACSYALLLESAGLRGLSLRDSLYRWDTLERVVAAQHILQGADSAYIKIEKSRRGALVRPPPQREDPAKRRYIETAGKSQSKMTSFFQ